MEFVEVDFTAPPEWAVPYIVPKAPTGSKSRSQFHEHESQDVIRMQIQQIVERHGSIHEETVLRSVREEWGLAQAGARIRESFGRAAERLDRLNRINRDGQWLCSPGQQPLVRVPREEGAPRRTVSEVPPKEIEHAIPQAHDA